MNICLNSVAWQFMVPNPIEKSLTCQVAAVDMQIKPIIDIKDVTSFHRTKLIMIYVMLFINKLKLKLYSRDQIKFKNYKYDIETNISVKAANYLLKLSQLSSYPDVFAFFDGSLRKKLPIVMQLNLFLDEDGLIRTDSKLRRLNASFHRRCPLLVDHKCKIASAIISDAHKTLKHAGVYTVLNYIRRDFWIPKIYSTVKSILRACVPCRRMHGRSIETNQNAYQSWRINPSTLPYQNIVVDHIGPFKVKNESNEVIKTYVLIISCLWSRAVNLIICDQITTSEFMRALTIHILEYGVPSKVLSDNGTPIVQGMSLLKESLDSVEVKNFLKEQNIEILTFSPYPANTSKLGGTIESLVKQVKFFVYGACQKQIHKYKDFQFLIFEIKLLINRRPIAYKNILHNLGDNEFPDCLTPEMIVKGYEIPSLSILPHLHENDDDNFFIEDSSEEVWKKVFVSYKKMQKIRRNIHEIYAPEFLRNLADQATNKQGRYSKKKYKELKVGDLVCIKNPMCKPYNYPLGIIVECERNSLNEINTVTLKKSNKEIIRRHVNDLILILQSPESSVTETTDNNKILHKNASPNKSKRNAAIQCQTKNKKLFDTDLA